jgi:hypothetical protein
MQALCELLGHIVKHELQIKLLGDAEGHGSNRSTSMHTPTTTMRPQAGHLHDLLEDSGHAHAFEVMSRGSRLWMLYGGPRTDSQIREDAGKEKTIMQVVTCLTRTACPYCGWPRAMRGT